MFDFLDDDSRKKEKKELSIEAPKARFQCKFLETFWETFSHLSGESLRKVIKATETALMCTNPDTILRLPRSTELQQKRNTFHVMNLRNHT